MSIGTNYYIKSHLKLTNSIGLLDRFRLCPPSLLGAYYLQPPDARGIFLHDDLLCNGTCSVIGGSITHGGGGAQTEKIRFVFFCIFFGYITIYPMPLYPLPLYPIHIVIFVP